MINAPHTAATASSTIDLDLIAQRILKLTEIATLEHLESLARTQADQLLFLVQQSSE